MKASTKIKFDYETKRWGITPIQNKYTNFQGLELEFFLEDIQKHYPKNKKEVWQVLDIGCGGGNIAKFLKTKFFNWQITGVDVSKDAITYAQKSFSDIRFLNKDAADVPFKDNTLDLAYAFDTLEHFDNLDKVLEKVSQKLKQGSFFYCAIPLEKQFPSLYWILYKFGWRGKREFAGHVNFFNNQEFVWYVEKYGFKLRERKYSNHLLFSLVDIAYYFSQSLLGKQAVSFESSISQLPFGIKKTILKTIKDVFSALTFFESSILNQFPGGKGHSLFEKVGSDFFSLNPPHTFLENLQLKYGLNRFVRPKDFIFSKYLLELNIKSAKNILDFGCADGLWLERVLKSYPYVKGWGVDISTNLIFKAKNRKNGIGTYILSEPKSKIDYFYRQNSFDICYSLDTFEHIQEKRKELKRIFQSLKKGGKILIYTLNKNNKYTFDHLFEIMGSDFLYKRADHDKKIFPTPKSLSQDLKSVGFKNISYQLYDGPFNLIIDVFCYLYLFLLQRLLTYLEVKLSYLKEIYILNDRLVRLITPISSFLDKLIVQKTKNSNGFFMVAEK